MIDILMIALEFAPVQTAGAIRSIDFAKRLPALGIRPTVLTIDAEQGVQVLGGMLNEGLLDGMPETVTRHGLKAASAPVQEGAWARFLRVMTSFDDRFQRRFEPDMLRTIARLRKERDFAAVYASAPPFGASLMGASAAGTLGVPYVLDMRDAWAAFSPAPQTSRLHYRAKRRDETRAFAAADAVVTVTPELAALFRDTHPEMPADKVHVITNGTGGVADLPDQTLWAPGEETVDIGYVGKFYYLPSKPASLKAPHRYLQYDPGTEDWSYRSPLYFFRAWAALDRRAPALGAKLRFHLVGDVPDWLPGMAREHGVEDRCVFLGRKPKQEIPAFLDRMTAVLGTSMKRIDGLDYCIASKSFEYLASGKPTLAFVCPGAQRRFFEEVGGAVVLDPDAPEDAAARLQTLLGTPRQALPVHKAALAAYDRDATATDLAALIHRLTGSAPRSQAPAPDPSTPDAA